MPEKEMRYPSLKILLQYLDANKRFQLVARCPCLKFVDKVTPLSMDYLYLGNGCININKHSYRLGVIRQYPKNGPKILKEYQRVNKSGGSDWELTEFGKLDFTSKVVHSGDIVVEPARDRIDRTPEEEDVQMEGYKRRLEHLKTLRKMKQRQEEMERIEAFLLEWNLSRENKQPPYTMYLQYTYTKPDKTKIIEYLEYNRNFDNAAKYLYDYFFKGRKREIRAGNTKIISTGGVLRLPEHFRLNTRSITTGSNVESMMNCLKPILTHQNFKSYCMYNGSSIGTNYNHSAVQSAPTCLIWNIKLTGDLLHLVLNDTHSRLCVQHPKLTKEEYIILIDKMIRDKRAVGTCYSFGIHNRNLVKAVLNEFKIRDGVTARKLPGRGCTRFPQTYIFPLDSSSDFNIRCERKKHYDEKKRENEPWTLWIQVDKKLSSGRDTKEGYSKLFNGLLKGKTDIGWSISGLVFGKNFIKDVIKEFIERDGVTFSKEDRRGCTRFPYTYRLPINNSTRISLYFDRTKKGSKFENQWRSWIFIEPNTEEKDIASDEYKKFLDKILSDKKRVGTRYPIGVKTIRHVKVLLKEVKARNGVTCRKLKHRGAPKFPYTYSCPLNNSSNLVIFCEKRKNYEKKDSTNTKWILWHCVEQC